MEFVRCLQLRLCTFAHLKICPKRFVNTFCNWGCFFIVEIKCVVGALDSCSIMDHKILIFGTEWFCLTIVNVKNFK